MTSLSTLQKPTSAAPARLELPMVEGTVRAGFPSPADDFSVKRQDLNDLLITHPLATFLWRVSGNSMVGVGIFSGDILVVNRALSPQHQDIVVAEVDNDFTVKQLYKRAGRIKLMAADPTFPDITFKDGQTLRICGVVTSSVKIFRKG
jgi:DNA polymerase V